jgi:molybdopterin converting factor small subunit
LFAVAKQFAGRESVEVELEEGATVAMLRKALAAQVPSLAAILPRVMFAVNARYAAESDPIAADAEIACIPPVSGG